MKPTRPTSRGLLVTLLLAAVLLGTSACEPVHAPGRTTTPISPLSESTLPSTRTSSRAPSTDPSASDPTDSPTPASTPPSAMSTAPVTEPSADPTEPLTPDAPTEPTEPTGPTATTPPASEASTETTTTGSDDTDTPTTTTTLPIGELPIMTTEATPTPSASDPEPTTAPPVTEPSTEPSDEGLLSLLEKILAGAVDVSDGPGNAETPIPFRAFAAFDGTNTLFDRYRAVLRVVDVKRGEDADRIIETASSLNPAAPKEYEYLIATVEVTVTDMREEEFVDINNYSFTLVDEAGDPYPTPLLIRNPEPVFDLFEEPSTQTARIPFYVAPGDTPRLVFLGRNAGGLWFELPGSETAEEASPSPAEGVTPDPEDVEAAPHAADPDTDPIATDDAP